MIDIDPKRPPVIWRYDNEDGSVNHQLNVFTDDGEQCCINVEDLGNKHARLIAHRIRVLLDRHGLHDPKDQVTRS